MLSPISSRNADCRPSTQSRQYSQPLSRSKNKFITTEFTVLFFNVDVSLICYCVFPFMSSPKSTFTSDGYKGRFLTMPQARTNSEVSLFKRAIESWPYVFIIVSVAGLAYIALTTTH